MSHSDDDKKGGYDVGYKKPPKDKQWQPGQSGNPAGKKKKQDGFLDLVKKIASEELVANKGGHRQAMSYLEAAIYALFAKAHAGNPQAFKIVADLLGKEKVEAIAAAAYSMTEADLSVLETTADWFALLEKARAEMADPAAPEMEEDTEDDDPTKYS